MPNPIPWGLLLGVAGGAAFVGYLVGTNNPSAAAVATAAAALPPVGPTLNGSNITLAPGSLSVSFSTGQQYTLTLPANGVWVSLTTVNTTTTGSTQTSRTQNNQTNITAGSTTVATETASANSTVTATWTVNGVSQTATINITVS